MGSPRKWEFEVAAKASLDARSRGLTARRRKSAKQESS
jgi:hypothetical protein